MKKYLIIFSSFIILFGCLIEGPNSTYTNLFSNSEEEPQVRFGEYNEELSNFALDICEDIGIETYNCPEVRFTNTTIPVRIGEEGWTVTGSPAGILYKENYIWIVDEDGFLETDERIQCAVIGHEIGHAYHAQKLNIYTNEQMLSRYSITAQNFADLMGAYLCEDGNQALKAMSRYYFNDIQRYLILENVNDDFIEDIVDRYY